MEDTIRCTLLDENYEFDVPLEIFGRVLRPLEEVSILKGELVREGLAFIMLIRKEHGSQSHRLAILKASPDGIGDDEVLRRWEKSRDRLRSFETCRQHWRAVLFGEKPFLSSLPN